MKLGRGCELISKKYRGNELTIQIIYKYEYISVGNKACARCDLSIRFSCL